MDEWEPCEDDIDWLCGQYTYKKNRLRRELQQPESGWDDFLDQTRDDTKSEKSFKCGACEAAIFENDINRNGQTVKIKKTVLQRRYKGQDGQWQSTSSLDVNDIPKAILAFTIAYDYLISGVDTGEV